MNLQTKRLVIRHFQERDLEDLIPFFANEEVMRFSVSGPLPAEKTREYFHKRILGHYAKGYGLYALLIKEKFIGFAGFLTQQIEGEEKIELGFRLLPEYWGKGLAFEACATLINYAFQSLHLKEIISIIDPNNLRSLKLAKRLGMYPYKDAVFYEIPVKIWLLDEKTYLDPSSPYGLR
jgi:[ribosomal protein S5]-alanine N-acetyltransferase